MRFGINLRGDLAKLDDTEIAARYETLVAEKEAYIRSLAFIQQNKLAYRLGTGLFGRRLLHARIFYRIQALLIGLLSALGNGNLVTPSSLEAFLRECEFKDVRDEMKRRIAARKAVAAT